MRTVTKTAGRTTGSSASHPLSVVLIEPDHDWRVLLELKLSLLRDFECTVSTGSVTTGLLAIAAARPDVVIVAFGTPTGDEAHEIALLRAVAGEAALVVATAHPSLLRRHELDDPNAIYHLDKMRLPHLEDELRLAMQAAAGRAGAPVPQAA